MWSCETRWKTKTIISLLTQCLWPQNLTGWWLYFTSIHKVTWPQKKRCPAKSRGKLKSYIHYDNVWGYKTWQGGDIHWEAFFNKITQTLDHVVLQGHVKYWSVFTSYTCVSLQGLNKDYTTTRLVATKLVKVMTYYEKLSSTNLHNPWTSSHIRPCDELKIFPLLQSLWPQNLACILYSMRSFPS